MTKILQKIAVEIHSDHDLTNLVSASPVLAQILNPDNADIWRRRFLAIYDYPLELEGYTDFANAYKLRRFVLRRVDGVALLHGQIEKAKHQLLVILDMILGSSIITNSQCHVLTLYRNLQSAQKASKSASEI